MRRHILAATTVLAVFACRDELVGPVEDRTIVQPEVTVSADAVTTVVQLLDDPLVRELMDGVGADAASLHGAARDASISRTTAHVLTLSRVLALTRSGLFVRADDGGEDPDDEILRAALKLVLDDVAALLEPQPPNAEEEKEEEEQRGRDVVHH